MLKLKASKAFFPLLSQKDFFLLCGLSALACVRGTVTCFHVLLDTSCTRYLGLRALGYKRTEATTACTAG